MRLTAEDESISWLKFGVEIIFLCFLAKKPAAAQVQHLVECFPMIHGFPLQMLPIVHPGPPEMVIIDLKAKRPDEPKLGPNGYTSTADTSGVVRNLGLVQHNMQFWLVMGHLDPSVRDMGKEKGAFMIPPKPAFRPWSGFCNNPPSVKPGRKDSRAPSDR